MAIESSRVVSTGGTFDEVSLALASDNGELVIVKRWKGRDELMEGLRTANCLLQEITAALRVCDEGR